MFDTRYTRREAYDWGLEAETLARDHLVREGYAIRETRWRPGPGHAEIDIIAELPGLMVFVEVKARSSFPDEEADPTAPAEAVDARKQKRISRAADIYLRALSEDYDYRFDIIAILGTPADHILTHITDAFISPVSSR